MLEVQCPYNHQLLTTVFSALERVIGGHISGRCTRQERERGQTATLRRSLLLEIRSLTMAHYHNPPVAELSKKETNKKTYKDQNKSVKEIEGLRDVLMKRTAVLVQMRGEGPAQIFLSHFQEVYFWSINNSISSKMPII